MPKTALIALIIIPLSGCISDDVYYTITNESANEAKQLATNIAKQDAEAKKALEILFLHSKIRIKIQQNPSFAVELYSTIDPSIVDNSGLSEESKQKLESAYVQKYTDCSFANYRNWECSEFFIDRLKMVDGILYRGKYKYGKHHSFRFSGLDS